jgi:CDP-diacylglycerol--glycerol-3-phosphate 3-phosphatidyltransferase
VNLPNAITAGRIALTPLIAWLPLTGSTRLRFIAFALFLIAAVTDYVDGMLARNRNAVTDLGRLLDPLADKLLLLATLVPMFLLQAPPQDWLGSRLPEALSGVPGATEFPFLTPARFVVNLPSIVVLVVLGRELLMTFFRQAAARRGVVIAAIGPAKWKTAFQSIWVGAAYFWFFLAPLTRWRDHPWGEWPALAVLNGTVGILSMAGAVVLTLYSMWLYLRRYGGLFVGRPLPRTPRH